MSLARSVELVVPAGIADPQRPSGGNTYDRRVRDELVASGWAVRTHEVAGDWPRGDARARAALARALEAAPDGSVVLLDGLVASANPEAVVPVARRLPTVVLVHMPVGTDADDVGRARERAVVRAAAAVVTTSDWTRRRLVATYALDPRRVHVARPGVDPAGPAAGSVTGTSLLCVGAVTPGKGHAALVAALGGLADRSWHCECVGPLTAAPAYVATVQEQIRAAGLGARVALVGPRTGADLEHAYAAADLLVLASRAETYGMVVTEALAHGLPVLACEVGGLPEALGETSDGERPGLLVPPDDVAALGSALARWLDDAALRRRLRAAAAHRRTTLTGWAETAHRVARVLQEAVA